MNSFTPQPLKVVLQQCPSYCSVFLLIGICSQFPHFNVFIPEYSVNV